MAAGGSTTRRGRSGSSPEHRDLHAFVLELGRALSLAGTAVSETQERLTRVAAASGAPGARVVVLPTALIISLGRAGWATVESIPQLAGMMRLDQISALYELSEAAERGEVEPADGLERLRAIRAMPPRRGFGVRLLAYAAMTAGLCLVLQPTPGDIAIATVFGAIVGTLVLSSHERTTLTILAPVLAATLVSALSFAAVEHEIADPGLRTMIPALVTLLPGGVLTTATLELASGEMVAGASRLVFGGLQLLLLSFGIIAGVELAGLPSETVAADVAINLLGWWAPWLGVVVFGLAAAVYFSAPPGALPWLMIVLAAAWIGQVLGGALVGEDLSAFCGALVMTPVALAIGRFAGAPPPQVTFLPAFWLLVPGVIGLIGVTEVVGNPADAGIEDLLTPIASIVSIALGVLGGIALSRATPPRRRPGSRP